MGDESEWKNLPAEEKVQHTAWRARVAGYEELIKLFQTLTDDKSPEFAKYLGLVKKFVVDSNVVAQEKGLEATLKFVENYLHSGRSAGEVCCGVIGKCLNQKPKIKRLGMDVLMAYIEAEKQDIVQEELIKGLTNKQPKVVAACVESLREALRDFGTKIVPVKPLLKQLQALLEDRDKSVREESKQLVIEIYRWIGAALKPQLTNLKPLQISELEAEFEKIPPSKPQQQRFLRSQQDLKAQKAAAAVDGVDNDDASTNEVTQAVEVVDEYEHMDPVDILSKLPKDFYDKIEEKKWQDRKEALEALEKLANAPKLEQGDYFDVVRALRKVVTKDSNVILVALAAKCIALLAIGLRKKFSPHAAGCIESLIEKFKEKKTNVVNELKNAADACFLSTNLEAISEICIAALVHKTPSVRSETASFLARCFSRCTVVTLPKKLLKPLVTALLETIKDNSPEVREAAFEALGIAMKVVTEKVMAQFLMDVDALKMAKIKECYEKASKPAPPSSSSSATKSGPPKAPSKKQSESAPASASSSSSSVLGAKKKPAASAKGKKSNAPKEEVVERELSDEAVEEKITSLFAGDILPGLASPTWKDRLESMEKLAEILKTLPKDDIPVQAIVRTIVKKPGLKDNNFQVLKLKVDVIGTLAQIGNFSKRSAEYCLCDLVDKIGDAKNGAAVQECLFNVAEATSLDFVALQVLTSAFEQKNPKNQSEAINWLCKALTQFGLKISVKGLIETINKALASANQAVRTSGISLLGTIYTYVGPALRVFFENEKPALLQQIDAEFERVKDQKPPAPTRGLKLAEVNGGGGEDDDGDAGDDNDGPTEINVADLLPRTDVSDKIDALLTDLSDKNWKVRKEALEKIQKIIQEAKFITPNIGALPESLKQRLSDSNKILVSMTIALCEQLAISIGPSIRPHTRSILPGLFSNFGDSKANVRKSAVDAVNKIMDTMGPTGLTAAIENEILLDALKIENPTHRAELFGWLSEKLPGCKKLPVEFQECIPILYNCLEDRNAEVRKKAGEAVLPFMIHCGFDCMHHKISLVKPVSKDVVMKALEQARPNLPAKPGKSASAGQVSTNQQQAPTKLGGASKAPVANGTSDMDNGPAPPQSASAASKSKLGKTGTIPGTVQKKSSTTSLTSATTKKKQTEDDDNSPPIRTSTESAKEQRFKDEKNLKTLKWNFDAPRREFLDQLRTQMELHFSKKMVELLFHEADFKPHVKALDMLIKECDEGLDTTRANLDLILRWISLRLFETNTTVLLKCLEYLILVFGRLSEANYRMDEIEATSFLPYLINRVGDPKDNVRRDIRRIIQLILSVYCSSRISFFLLEGIKSKNVKVRTECLEELGNLIHQYGMERFQPNMAGALKTIAEQIGHKDNNVRSAALNAIVDAFVMHGEVIFKLMGKLNEKDMSMLEERIKRSSKTKNFSAPPGISQPSQLGIPSRSQKQNSPEEKPKQSKLALCGQTRVPEALRAPVEGQFQLESEDSDVESEFVMPELIEPDLKDVDEPINLPTARCKTMLYDRKKSNVTHLIAQVSSMNINRCIQALQEIEVMLKDGKKLSALQVQNGNQMGESNSTSESSEDFRGCVDALLSACTLQLRMMHNRQNAQDVINSESITLYKCILGTIMALCRCKHLSIEADKLTIKELTQILIMILLDPKLNMTQEGKNVTNAVNVTVVKIVENMNANNVMGALIELLQEIAGNEQFSPQFRELVMKCLWKMTRMIPSTINQLDVDQIIGDIHTFLVAYPGPTRNKTFDMPLRTIKTILHTLIKHKGEAILNHLTLVRERGSSEVEQFMRRVLKSLPPQGEQVPENTLTDSVNSSNSLGARTDQDPHKSPRISKAVQDSLAKIFQKIGCKENTVEGLNDLYDFKVRHPDADLEPFLKKSSPFFQDYINKGLKGIETARQQPSNKIIQNGPQTKAPMPSTPKAHGSILPEASSDLSPQHYAERLMILRSKFGLDNSDFHVSISMPQLSSLDCQSSPGLKFGGDNTPSNETPSPFSTRGTHLRLGGILQAQGDSAAIGQSNVSNSEIDDLKKRFEKVKNPKRD